MLSFVSFSERLARGELKNTSAVEQTNLGEKAGGSDLPGSDLQIRNGFSRYWYLPG